MSWKRGKLELGCDHLVCDGMGFDEVDSDLNC